MEQKPLSPVRFLQPLAKVLLDIVLLGKYSKSSYAFKVSTSLLYIYMILHVQVCVSDLLYQCCLAGVVSSETIVQCLWHNVGQIENIQVL